MANLHDDTVTRLRPSDGVVIDTIHVGRAPSGLAFDGTHIWVTNRRSGSVMKLRAADGLNLGTFAFGKRPIGIVAGRRRSGLPTTAATL